MSKSKASKRHKTHSNRLQKMRARHSELVASCQQAQDALKVSGFGDALIEGKPVDKLAADLSRQRNEVTIYEGALAELESQINAEQAAVDEAAQMVADEQRAEAARKIRSSLEQVVRGLADTQLELARCGRLAGAHNVQGNAVSAQGLLEVGFALAQAADRIESNPEIKAALDGVPRGERCGGFIDEDRRESSRGAAVMDWAWRETAGAS